MVVIPLSMSESFQNKLLNFLFPLRFVYFSLIAVVINAVVVVAVVIAVVVVVVVDVIAVVIVVVVVYVSAAFEAD